MPENPKLLNLRKANHLTENSRMKNKWNENFQERIFESWVYVWRYYSSFF